MERVVLTLYMFAGLSDDGTGSSNSIYDPTFNGDFDPHTSYAPEVIPEESSGRFNSRNPPIPWA